jgi:DNA-binding beta-propeller fold protein YncE
MVRFLARRAGRKVVHAVRPSRGANGPTVDGSFVWNNATYRAQASEGTISIIDTTTDAVITTIPTTADASTPVVHCTPEQLWMFTTLAVPGASLDDELHVFHALDPAGPWQPVANNPVVSDARAARPAGTVESVDGVLVRPVWNAVHRRVDRYVIETLEPHRFAQRPFHPAPDPARCVAIPRG